MLIHLCGSVANHFCEARARIVEHEKMFVGDKNRFSTNSHEDWLLQRTGLSETSLFSYPPPQAGDGAYALIDVCSCV